MKIAVTYENGQVFQHFGHTEQFKIYTVDDENILSSEIVNTDGTGHGALADFLKERGVNVLIFGGIGAGAVRAGRDAGIQLFGGAAGGADDQVLSFLGGNLHFSSEANCSHHDGGHDHTHHGECASHDCGGHCGA